MPTFDDNIKTIKTAIYGKEMRPAIAEALTQSRDTISIMTSAVDALNKRVDAITAGGGEDPGGSGGGVVITDELIPPILVVYGVVSLVSEVSNPSLLD